MAEVTLDNCADEPIHIPESIQSYGYLLAVCAKNFIIEIVSANISTLLNVDIQPGVSKLAELIETPETVLAQLQFQAETELPKGKRQVFQLPLRQHLLVGSMAAREYHCIIYRSANYIVIEIEPATEYISEKVEYQHAKFDLKIALPALYQVESLDNLADQIANSVKKLTTFDRVMIYKFDSQYNGSVIAEVKEANLETFLGLQFPASDIPKQARKLYETNWIRMITDIDQKVVPLLPPPSSSGRAPLDMSHSLVRSVSPIHIQYLRNMRVQATMSISLMNGEALWGLIACHHYSPKYIAQTMRLDCEMLAQLYSWQLNAKEVELTEKQDRQRLDDLDVIVSELESKGEFADQLQKFAQPILQLMNAEGFAIYAGQATFKLGDVPADDILSKIIKHLINEYSSDVVSTHRLVLDVPNLRNIDSIAGVLVAPLSIKHNYFAIWLREPVSYTINWAGKDSVKNKLTMPTSQERLTPRGSFALWKQTVENESRHWKQSDTEIAIRFNRSLVKHVIERKVVVEQNLEKMLELDQVKDQFLASISHELRSPLNAIMGWTELALFNREDNARAFEALEVIKRSATHQSQLINDLLDVSRIVSGTLKLSIQSVNVAAVIKDVCEVFDTALQSKGITLSSVVDNDADSILGDPMRIKQIISNLLGNSIKFTAKGGKIKIFGRRDNSTFVVIVEDNGKGIEADDLPRLFDRFYQPADSSRENGLGLGLSIVKNLVELHGGTVTAFSEGKGKGAKFTVNFPISPVLVTDQNPEFNLSKLIETEQGVVNDARLNGLRILVVEDDKDANRFISLFLTRQGAQVESVFDGKQAWEQLNTQNTGSYDLVLSDIGMPFMDGYELITRIRSSEESTIQTLRAVALTAYAYSSDRIKALKSGFTSYVAKPVDSEELITVIETACRQ